MDLIKSCLDRLWMQCPDEVEDVTNKGDSIEVTVNGKVYIVKEKDV